MKRLIVALVVVIAMLGFTQVDALAGPNHAANGKYEGIDIVDGSNLSVKIRNNRIDFRDDGGSVCEDAGLGFVAARHRGSPVVIDETTVSVTADVECKFADGWVAVLSDFTLTYSYDAATNLLSDDSSSPPAGPQTYSRV